MPTTLHENRPSAGIGVVQVQKPMVFCDFQHARATLCGDRRGQVQKPMVFYDFCGARATLCGDRRGRGAKTHGSFCDFCGARATLCGNRRGRGAKTRGFLRFLQCSRNPLRESAWSRCKKLEAFCVFCCPRELSRGSRACSRAGGSRVRFLPGPRAGVARCNLLFKATCAEQLAQSNLCRPTCADQFAQSALPRATCQ